MPGQVEKTMRLDLAQTKMSVKPTKKKITNFYEKNKLVPRSPEEIYFLSQLPPACDAKHSSIKYLLSVKLKYDGMCFGKLPHVQIPLSILPETKLEAHGFQEPAGYTSIDVAYIKIDL